MDNKKKIAAIISIAVVFALALAMFIVGCFILKAANETKNDIAATTVAVDDYDLLMNGKLTIFSNGQFIHEEKVTDYVAGDPRSLVATHNPDLSASDVVGIYCTQKTGEANVTNKAVLKNGSIVTLDTKLHRLPRTSNGLELNGPKEGFKLIMSINLDDSSYRLTIQRLENGTIVSQTVDNIVDATAAYDTIYYMVGDTVYSLDWLDPSAKPKVYCKDALGVSHHIDEAEGAIVPTDRANREACGRYDIYSPYPNK